MYKLLVVDDEARIRSMIRKCAEFKGYDVTEAADGMQAVQLCRNSHFDIIIMDIMMPELDGFSACREIRKNSQIPIIMLSARGEEYDRINGFELGVDDYVVKPFSPNELMLRIAAIMNRVSRSENNHNVESEHQIVLLDNGRFKVDFTARIVYIDDERIDLSPKEYDLLFYMIKNRNVAISREKFISDIWGYDFYGDVRTLDTHIKLLRRSLGRYADMIVTLRGVGYRFEGK